MAIRTVTFAALPDQVSPCTPQDAGVQGDHQATAVVFELDPSLVSADYCCKKYEYDLLKREPRRKRELDTGKFSPEDFMI